MNHVVSVSAATALAAMLSCAAADGMPSDAGKPQAEYVVNLDNLMPYTHWTTGWSDRYSTVCLTWLHPEKPGLETLTSMLGFLGTRVTDSLLTWSVTEDGQPLDLTLVSRNYRPDKVIETDSADGLTITATVAVPERNGFGIEFTVRNDRNVRRAVELSFGYPGKGCPPNWTGPFPVGSFVSIDGEPEGSWSTLYPVLEHGRNVLWVQTFAVGLVDRTSMEMCCIADLKPRVITLEPNCSARFAVPMGLGKTRKEAKDVYTACSRKIDRGWTPEAETKRLIDLLNSVPRIAPKYRGNPQYERMYAQAVADLNSLFIRGDGGYTGYKRVPWTIKYGLGLAFFWDSSFTCVGGREMNADACKETIECFVENPTPRGSLPGTLCDTHRAGEGQSPIMAWAAWSIYQRTHDKRWLKRVYPGLSGNIDFWLKYHSSPRGLCQFFNAGQVADNDARFDPIQGENTGNQDMHGFESPDLNSFLVMEMKCLSQLAREIGLKEDSAKWQKKADELGQLIIETMYFPEDAMFFDVKSGTREKLSGVKGPNMFLPLWAGVPLPKEEVKRIVEGHMLNPDEFYRELPFPSLSYDDPKFDPDGYWRGRIWPHVVYWMIQTLWRQGYHEEAEVTADRLLRLMQTTPWLHENYGGAPGVGAHSAEYNWSLATAIELLLERYKDPLP